MMDNKAYLRYLLNVEQFELSFNLVLEEPKLSRSFNFLRQNSETVGSLLNRVKVNIEKYLNKKSKSKGKTLETSLIVNDVKVKDEEICKDVFKTDRKIILYIDNKELNVIVNSPWVNTIALPDCLLENFPIYLKKFEVFYCEAEYSEFKWFRSATKLNWIEIGNNLLFTPKGSEVNHYLKLCVLPRNSCGLEGPTREIISNTKVLPSPKQFPFEHRHKYTKNKLEGNMFRIVSYNILADLYCDSDHTRVFLFPYTPPHALKMEYRQQLILKEIIGYNADIICLQEVDKKIFDNFSKILSEYDGELCLKGGDVMEGVACFYRTNRFDKITTKRIELSKHIENNEIFSEISANISKNENLRKNILDRTTVLSVSVLQSKDNLNEILIIANTHLYFHPDADNIRLLQGGLIIKYLEHFLKDLEKIYNKRVSLVFCGDFNSSPDCGIYKLYTTGQVSDENCIDFKSNSDEEISGIKIEQSLKLNSAYGTPKYTNFTKEFAGCLDYIYYENNKLSIAQVVPLPDENQLKENTALPSIVFPSDHLALIADIKWI